MTEDKHIEIADSLLFPLCIAYLLGGLLWTMAAVDCYSGRGSNFLFGVLVMTAVALPGLLWIVRRRQHHLREAEVKEAERVIAGDADG